ncbi:cyclopropane-fatty-acyl-phospholipid synthase [Humidesulfovibrio mexicanus]|uniref:Cyclopropane-fatty-acyl-phospholipid synthase n=1 Tax=Humidesulfovibrio mexicanus TaxID=147047 RepID=A0A239CIK2_9BACT|nr:cyclopropane fatty acyl phospholipid synthase [Humidesulfovibrio mexicanus]SNS19163.1 cyclopropane-fatty-acyl-phospholipid synthase [Humidesulfovibrio mexicanus]
MSESKSFFTGLLASAGVTVDGPNPWDIHVHDERLYPSVLARRNLALGEAYTAGWWDCERIDEFIQRVLASGAAMRVKGGLRLACSLLPAYVLNLQSPARAQVVARRHYDLGNELFTAFLDPYLQYSCAYFKDTADLAEAQQRKLRLICAKLGLRQGERLLDIGCGWGGLAKFAAEQFGVSVVGVNISARQIAYAREFCAGLPVEIRACDYRELDEPFDKIVSVGMFEHVGGRNYKTFMDVVARCLKPGGVFLLHTIGGNVSAHSCDPWIAKYIFPNGMLPSIAQIARAAEGRLVMEDWHNLGPHYDPTLMAWLDNFRAAWPRLREAYGEGFRRMWEYYLQCCAGAFRARDIQLWQVVFGTPGSVQPRCRWG